jgi:hypothetical protein
MRVFGGCAARLSSGPRHEHLGIRRRPFGNYLIFYRVGADVVGVVHVLDGARDYERLLFPETSEGHRVARKRESRHSGLRCLSRYSRTHGQGSTAMPGTGLTNRARHFGGNKGSGTVGAQERTRTFTAVKPLAPEASASTNSATWARAG